MSSLARLSVLALAVCAPVSQPAFGQSRSTQLVDGVKARDRICFTLYTVHDRTLKLTAQFYPLHEVEPFSAQLQFEQNGQWETVATSDIAYPGYTATFRVKDLDDRVAHPYRVAHNNTAFYEGVVRKNPVDRDEFVMAAFSCNSVNPAHGGDISKQDIVENLRRVKPDLIFFAGDQVYDHSQHYRYWLRFGRDFGDILRNTPTVCLPDDHDVGQANLWGDGGKRCPSRDGQAGGYYMPVEYVREVERAQTSHLPDPFDPTPVDQGIGVYYTHLRWGGMSFAIVEDRKFKSAPATFNKRPEGRPDSITSADYDPRDLDSPDAQLLGERQLRFLEHWTTDWRDAQMKCVLSQSPFAQMCNYSGQHERELFADFDSNGWPQSGRERALRVIRKSYSSMIAGDQHLGGVVHHGIDQWRDSGFSFAAPAIANYWLRWWDPEEPGKNRRPDSPDYTGDFLDGFGNKMTVLAAANPTDEDRREDGSRLSTRAAGFGIVRFNKPRRTTTFECWPRNVDVTSPDAAQYKGWPITVTQASNNPMSGKPQLPTLLLPDANLVVTVIDDATGEVVTSHRVAGNRHQPSVPAEGRYNVGIRYMGQEHWIRELTADRDNREEIDVGNNLSAKQLGQET